MEPQTVNWVALSIQLILLLTAMILAFYLWSSLQTETAMPPKLVAEFVDKINKREFKNAFDLMRVDKSFVSQVLAAGMSKIMYGNQEARNAYTKMADVIQNNFKSAINYLPALAAIATVVGLMINQNTNKETDGQSVSVYVALLAVLMAIPCVLGHVWFSNRLVRIDLEVRLLADDLLTQMYHNSGPPKDKSQNRPIVG